MFSKILVGVFAVAVMGVGGYSYYQHSQGCCPLAALTGSCSSPCESTCPLTPPTGVSTGLPCCSGGDEDSEVVEVLTIEPREVK